MKLVLPRLRSAASGATFFVAAGTATFAGPVLASPAAVTELAAARATLRFEPQVGHSWTYEVMSRGTTTVDIGALAARLSPNQGAMKSVREDATFEVTARVGMRVIAKEADGYLVAFRLADPRYVVNGEEDGRSSVLTTPFSATMSAHGEFSAFRFPNQFPQEAKLAIRSLVDSMQVVLPGRDQATWTAQEVSASGRSVVDYRVGALDQAGNTAHLTRQVKSARRTLAGQLDASDQVKMSTQIEHSDGHVELALDGTGLQKITLNERSHSYAGRDRIASADLTFSAVLVPGSVDGLPTTPAEMEVALKDQSAARAHFYTVPPSVAEKIANVTWEQAIEAYFGMVTEKMETANHLMMFYLRKHPERSLAFARALDEHGKKGESDDIVDAVSHGFATLASAGHTEAQRVLVDVISQPGWTQLSRAKARDGMFNLELPELFIPAAVWAERSKIPTAGKRIDTEGLSIWTNLYGYVGSSRHGVFENSQATWQNLSKLLQSGDAYEQARGLVAIGNLNDAKRALPSVQPFFTSSKDFLRARAYEVFRNSTDEQDFLKFASFYAQEKLVAVRTEASAIALSMAPSKARNEWAVEQVKTSADNVIRLRAVRMLGLSIKDFPQNEKVLQDLLEDVRDRETRRAIYGFVKARRQR